ncbi:hypothetical protein N7466_009957 [Penicillium verhagenii]|uniref:uncharacterized protein n=1 Tax=Penicillium verhagenii TaxID=1562060 RepID=UPI0025458608|nr:uncharacterized protein N7466_009957 [Penicillium verhagenii]KAJ5919014.1 hypothetical protein N7466_009957 [Penicillium verhagenii]
MSFMNEATGLSSRVSYKDYLQYFLYGGMIYLALKQWRKALHFLGAVISMPTIGSVSMIMVEAYKKWILVGLLEKGKLCSPPSMTAPHIFKTFQALSKPYIALAHAFEYGDVKRIEAEVDAAKEIWCMDNNMGLVSQVVNAYSTHSLIKAKKVFTALTMAELSAHTPLLPADANGVGEAHIASLIVSEDTDATLVHSNANSTDTMLHFGDLSSLLKMPRETNIQAQFKQEGQLLESLFGGVEGNGNRLGLCDEFLDGVLRGQSWPSGGGMNLLGMGGNGGVGLEMEEDIMGDLS